MQVSKGFNLTLKLYILYRFLECRLLTLHILKTVRYFRPLYSFIHCTAHKKGPCAFNGKLYIILFREICLARWPMWATPPARIILPCRGKGYGVLNVFTVIPLSPQAPVFVVIHFCNLFWWLSGGGTMWIQIRTIDGKETRTIEDLSRLTKIEYLRLKIKDIFNVNPQQQRLFYRGKQVDAICHLWPS